MPVSEDRIYEVAYYRALDRARANGKREAEAKGYAVKHAHEIVNASERGKR